jgi:hypothetical protein
MPDLEKDDNNSKGGGGGKADPPVGTIEFDVGGKPRQFADLAELQAEFGKAHDQLAAAASNGKKLSDAEAFQELAKTAVMTGDPAAQRDFYRAIGVDDKKIMELLDGGEGDDDDDESDEGGKGGKGGGEVNIDDIAARVLEKMEGKIDLMKHSTPESFQLLEELARRVKDAGSMVTQNAQTGIETEFARDKIIGKYFGVLEDRQKAAVLKHVITTKGASIAQGKNLTREEFEAMRTYTRSWLADVYGPADEFARRSGGSDELGGAAFTSGFEGLSNEELGSRLEKSLDPDHEEPPDKRGSGLLQRMKLRYEHDLRGKKSG